LPEFFAALPAAGRAAIGFGPFNAFNNHQGELNGN
jgi:hypothetical protein